MHVNETEPCRRAPPRARGVAAIAVVFLAGVLAALPVSAQVQRNFANLSFESPALQTAGCRVYIAASQVPGWNTTHPNAATENSGGCVVPAGFTQTAPILEMWRTPRDSASGGAVTARNGTQIAELNAVVASRIFQNVCLINGRQVDWRLSHRGRASATVRDIMEFKVGASQVIARLGTSNNGTFDAPVALLGTVSAANAAGNPTWVDYSGSFVYSGATGTTSLGFESVSASGGASNGNLLDDIQIAVVPFVEFASANGSSPESTGGDLPALRVNGTVTAPFNVTVTITGGSATRGTDYTTPGNSATLTVTIPAGIYDGVGASSLRPLPITVVDDSVAESNETILFSIVPPPAGNAPFELTSNTTCGGAAQATTTYTIIDDDAGIVLSKRAAAPVPVVGNPAQDDVVYTVVATNPSSTTAVNYSLSDRPGFDPDVSIVSASYTLNGGAAIALAGSGPWTLQPQWRALAASATDTYVVTVRLNVNRGGGVANDACAAPSAPGSGLHNAADAVVQGRNGGADMPFNATACQATPTPVWVTLRKQLVARAAANDQAQVRIFSAGILSSSATTTGATAPAGASTGLVVLPAGNTMQFEEAIKTSGSGADRSLVGYRPQLACTNAGTATSGVPSGAGTDLGNRQQWAEFSPAAGADLDCTITNALNAADLSVTKTNGVDSVVSGAQTTYAITVRNAGPDAANGAVLADPAPTGLAGCTLAAVPCTPAGGAVCPTVGAAAGQLSIANLQGAGVVVPTLPNGGSIVVNVTCTVQ